MPWLAAAAAATGALGGILGADESRSGATAAGNAQKAAIAAMIAKLDAIGMPPDQSAKLILDQYKQAGILTPQLEQQVQASVSDFSKIKTDEATRGMQVQALQRMAQLGKAGLTPDERAQMRQLQAQAAQQGQSAQQAIIQNLAARGQGGQGAEIAARLGASQGAAQQASSAADQVSALAAQRALQALGQQSSMAGQLRASDFGEEAQKAAAADQMNRFNVQNQMAINQRNVGASNVAQEANLSNLQNIQNANVGQSNQEKYNQLQRQRQNWLDKLSYAQAYASPLQQYGNAAAQQALGESSARAQGIASGFGGLSSYLSSMGGAGGGGTKVPSNDGSVGPTVQNQQQQYGNIPYYNKIGF